MIEKTNNQEIIIYNTDDGKTSVSLMTRDGNVWLNQNHLAELFDTSKQNISLHIINILKDNELDSNSVVKDYLTTAADGKNYNVTFYSLDMILAIGFRVRSKRGTQFRQWANRNLKDIYIAKNYLSEDEIDSLNRMVIIFLEVAELQAKGKKDITMKLWRENVDGIITFNKKELLIGKGSVSNEQMEKYVDDVYEIFNQKRKRFELQQADAEDMEELKQWEEKIKISKTK